MNLLARIAAWLNIAANVLGRLLLAPLGALPGWLSATIVAAATGVLLLVVFKHTSAQKAIKRVRSDINADLLALKLFKDSATVTMRMQGRLLVGAARLCILALVPTIVMIVPVTLILGQLSLWYQQRPLHIGEEAVVTVKLKADADAPFPALNLQPTTAVKEMVGPVRVLSKREACWSLEALQNGYHRLSFQVGDRVYDKELAIGDGFMRVSAQRPGWIWSEVLLYPWEEPFGPDSPVQSIDIAYPRRESWTSGTDLWVIYWFVVSLVAAFCFRRALGVNV